MEKKQYDQARELFPQLLSIDPDNATIAAWQKEIAAYEEQKKLQEQQKQVQSDINSHGWTLFREAMDWKKKKKYFAAIGVFQKIIDIGVSDQKLVQLSKKMMDLSYAVIRRMRNSVLKMAKEKEDASEYRLAFKYYKSAARIDPRNPSGFAGMNRIRGILHDKAKALYAEAILLESFSDFDAAKKIFKQCQDVAPEDDIYYDRAKRKLAHFLANEGEVGAQQGATGTNGAESNNAGTPAETPNGSIVPEPTNSAGPGP
jgi:tetratricopeptide (TPR) repeat protein